MLKQSGIFLLLFSLIVWDCHEKAKDLSVINPFHKVLAFPAGKVFSGDNALTDDSARMLIRELNLSRFFNSPEYCLRKDNSTILPLSAESGYPCFLFITAGGSGGQTVQVYHKISGKYEMTNDFFAFFEKIPGSITRRYYDINLAFRDYSRGMINILFIWNGRKYVQSKILSINYFPLDLLLACGITDRNKLTAEYPYVGEKAEYDMEIYGRLHLDTIKNENGKLLLSLKASANFNYGADREWKVRFENGRYIRL